jgi:hypothetical protein
MKTMKAFVIVGLLLAFAIMLPVARADEANQATVVTFSQPVQIPGQVLPAGTYQFVVLDGFDRQIVRIYNSNRSKVIATVHAVTRQRQQATGSTAITLAERGMDQPESIVAWFYPGRTDGHQLIYSKQEARELAQAKQQTVVIGD